MLLTVEIGNTTIHLGTFTGSGDHAGLVRDWRLHTHPQATADELALLFRGLLGPDIDQITGVAALSTVPSLLREMRALLPAYFPSAHHLLLEPGVRTGVPLLVDNPKEVGTDRVANCLAAYANYGGPCIVVACGTATVVDAVSAKGEFLGGAIAPGINLGVEALSEHTVTVRRVELMPPRGVLGKNTVEALQSGIIYGFAGQIDGLVERISDTVPGFGSDDVTVVATGSLAPLIYDECRSLTDQHPYLTLDGLRRVYERSRKDPRGRR
ncbi:type III pantothenate kinase [Gordonia pseudamarae]|jgi:type III pantothenate kinase|uniref:Type III pantothenate kinase n=1 Tax=Gordonia pseudamarae TaxID=2831662 RepID=A0ABX6IE58_9ACTN|nr:MULTISPECIES: type III pantothenate kinase [Gordonia]MBD0021488.1 type III pantothenate kinase [Gordonia sp. (in: high G+C Gram-positive bacteria)]QHN25210.1 type III pantothenate kinase [Gordonia pseudamarae]QHN34142.1 type III pantothenate kinase [Gordonia pseudamarae]